MEINKQLFEDVLSGKLKGTFVLKNGFKVSSDRLCKKDKDVAYKYWLKGFSPLYAIDGTPNSIFARNYTIVDFIPYTDMKQNELTIQIPENQKIDWQESAKQEKIVFKKKDAKPRSWEEYCEQQSETRCYVLGFNVIGGYCDRSKPYQGGDCTVPTKELAEAFVAMMKLMSLRQAWIGDWKPNWNYPCSYKYCIDGENSHNFKICQLSTTRIPLSFPTLEMATDFMNTFKDLLEIAKPLI
jgi:hypothetical protein